MALQKKNNLFQAHLVVTLFWFVVLFFASAGFEPKMLAGRLTYAVMVMVLGVLCGVTLWVAVDVSRRNGILSKSGAHHLRGAGSTIGPIPVPKSLRRGKTKEDELVARFAWWTEYRKNHPAHARAMRAVLEIMHANPSIPASPVPGGHGGATLIEHSFNVVDTMLAMAPQWVYRGHRNKKGEISFPLLDNTRAEFRFVRDDPILALAALAHDIGKMACYQVEGGTVHEVRKDHDIEGAKILRGLPEIMELPWKDRVAILSACEFYHHIGSLPQSTWIDDRARSLVELLIAADIATGQREGGVIVNDYEDVPDVAVPAPAVPEPQGTAGIEPDAEDRVVETRPPASSVDVAHGSPLDITYSILLEPGRVNGTDSKTRIAWKHGEWLYIVDQQLRKAVAERLGDASYNNLPHRGNMHAFTLELMAQLAEGGNLLQEFDGQQYSAKRAIYTTRSNVPGKTKVQTRYVVVARVAAFPGLENGADCRVKPDIVGCTWGEKAAINKNQGLQDSTEMEDAELTDQDFDEVEDVEFPDQDSGEDEAKEPLDEVELLLDAVAKMTVPYTEKKYNGVDYFVFEASILKDVYPGVAFESDQLIRGPGEESGTMLVGVKKK